MKTWQKTGRVALTAAVILGASGVTSSAFSTSAQAAPTVRDDGPHSPVGRHPANTQVTRDNGVAVSRYDLGDAEVGNTPGAYRAPMRGSLITPVDPKGPTKLIIISHLRTAGCANDVFAFPCPGKDIRLDRGMEYLGKALAARGYTVLIPDLAPVWIGTTLKTPYDQTSAWLKVVGGTRAALSEDVTGHSQHFGLPLTGKVDMSGAGLLVHSRSGLIAGPAIQAWSHGPTPITSVLAYGPAYDVPDAHDHITAPIAGNVPYLGIVGDADHDVPFNANLWLAENIEQRRTAPALVTTLPGLGHNYINRALSSTHTDDRIDCTSATCAPASKHEQVLTDVAEDYFDATLRHQATSLPLTPTSPFPTSIDGLPAQWLGVTNSAQRVTVLNADSDSVPTASKGSSVGRCRFYDPQDPTHHAGACPDTDAGSVMLVSSVYRAKLARNGSLTVPTHLTGAQALELQIAPYGDRTDHASSSPLQVTVTLGDGRRVNVPVSAQALEALKNRTTADDNGTYPLSTMRIPLPADLRATTITSVILTAPQGGTYAVRSIDALASGGGTPAGAPSAPSSPSGNQHSPGTAGTTPPKQAPSRPARGPVVQTDYLG